MNEFILQMNAEIALEEFNSKYGKTEITSNEELETYNWS